MNDPTNPILYIAPIFIVGFALALITEFFFRRLKLMPQIKAIKKYDTGAVISLMFRDYETACVWLSERYHGIEISMEVDGKPVDAEQLEAAVFEIEEKRRRAYVVGV